MRIRHLALIVLLIIGIVVFLYVYPGIYRYEIYQELHYDVDNDSYVGDDLKVPSTACQYEYTFRYDKLTGNNQIKTWDRDKEKFVWRASRN